jgi:alkanesulfonate monooxygenase
MLIYTDNSLLDPWLVAQIVLENTEHLSPLVAVQAAYMHPYSVAKMVTSLATLHDRRVHLNMVAGGFKNDLAALNDTTPHDARYERLIEYTRIIRGLLESGTPMSFTGKFYQVTALALVPRLKPELFPDIFISGSSEAGLEAARALQAIAVKYPEPPDQCTTEVDPGDGVRVGIIARPDESQAWKVALERYPEDRKGRMTHALAMKVSDSAWHHKLSEIGGQIDGTRETYWLTPFLNYKTFCPYLVGSYENVARVLAGYMRAGYKTYILDIPAAEEEFEHIGCVFEQATARVKREEAQR